jgi:pimeloyl-ACP methyl ester carboxylesterase
LGGEALYITERGDGPTMVMVHGLMATGDMFRWLAEPLAARFRLIVPDLPGHGRSGAVPGPYTVEAMAAELAATLDSRGVRDAHVMGYSHGGTVAQQLARDTGHLVRSLALVATYAYNTATRRERIEGWLAPRRLDRLGRRPMSTIPPADEYAGNPIIDAAEQALRAFGDQLDRAAAARILPLWRHHHELTDRERAAVLARFPQTVSDPKVVRR